MKSPKFGRAMEDILLYCNLASDCIIVAEINDLITRNEFIADFSKVYSTQVLTLKDFAELIRMDKTSDIVDFSDKVIILDEVLSGNGSSISSNLNYNRDWLLSLHLKIVIMLPTIIVEKTIQYSNNFWSCVSLYRSFRVDYPCAITPHLIDGISNSFESHDDHIRKVEVERKIKIRTSASGIIQRNFNITGKTREKDLTLLLNKKFKQIDITDQQSIIEFFNFVFDVGKELYVYGHYKYALRCFSYIQKIISIGDDYDFLLDQLEEAIAETLYRLFDYKESIRHYNRILSRHETEAELSDRFFSPFYVRILNNLAIDFYYLNNYDMALWCFEEMWKLESFPELVNNVVYSEVLYNRSVLAYASTSYMQALDYINKSIQVVGDVSSRHYTVLSSMYRVFKAYVLASVGDILSATSILNENLGILRQEVYENNLYVLEAHFAYAFAYYQNNSLDRALRCALKAKKISKQIYCTSQVKTQISELLGEIYYYKRDYAGAKQNLGQALRYQEKHHLFNDDIASWLSTAMKVLLQMP